MNPDQVRPNPERDPGDADAKPPPERGVLRGRVRADWLELGLLGLANGGLYKRTLWYGGLLGGG